MAGSGQGVTNRFTFSSLPRTERGQPIVMDKDPRATTVTTTASALAKMDLLETNVIHQERKKSKVTLQQNCS